MEDSHQVADQAPAQGGGLPSMAPHTSGQQVCPAELYALLRNREEEIERLVAENTTLVKKISELQSQSKVSGFGLPPSPTGRPSEPLHITLAHLGMGGVSEREGQLSRTASPDSFFGDVMEPPLSPHTIQDAAQSARLFFSVAQELGSAGRTHRSSADSGGADDDLPTGRSEREHDEHCDVSPGCNELADMDERMFVRVCDHLDLGLSKTETIRLFGHVDKEGHGRLTLKRMRAALPRVPLLRAAMSRYRCRKRWSISAEYRYDASTSFNYKHPKYQAAIRGHDGTSDLLSPERIHHEDIHGPLVGEYRDIRKNLDYSYHVNYTEERQLWQDNVVRGVAVRHTAVPRPWIVFTAGAMGSGKGFVMRWLSAHGMFPLEVIAKIDPDEFKAMLPEWAGYVKRDNEENKTEAGTLCHRESGFLVEVAQEVSLRASQNIWVDGSLQDFEWYSSTFKDIRQRYPHYRLAVFYVHCSAEKVVMRAEKRAKLTGRSIPASILSQSIERTRESILRLGPLADVLCVIRNEGSVPALELFEDRTGSMRAILDRFSVHPEPPAFPRALRPMVLEEVKFGDVTIAAQSVNIRLSRAVCSALSTEMGPKLLRFSLVEAFGDNQKEVSDALRRHGIDGKEYDLVFSPSSQNHMDYLSGRVAGIPSDVERFAWCFGAVRKDGSRFGQSPETRRTVEAWRRWCGDSNPIDMLMMSGGFIYVGNGAGEPEVLCINTFSQRPTGAGCTVRAIHFAPPMKVPASFARQIIKHGRMMPTTKREILRAGMETYTWILPSELPGCAPFGGFMYAYNEREMLLFPCTVAP